MRPERSFASDGKQPDPVLRLKSNRGLRRSLKQNYASSRQSNISRMAQLPRMSTSLRALVLFISAAILNAVVTRSAKMVRLCIASVDPVKLSSQCVMCIRREFPLTVIDCTGITKVNDLIANPLSVQEATCLIYNCRRVSFLAHESTDHTPSEFETNAFSRYLQQVPEVKPEPYHGSVSQAVRTNYPMAAGSRGVEMIQPLGMYGGYSGASSIANLGGLASTMQGNAPIIPQSPFASSLGLTGGSSILGPRQRPLPYALLPSPFSYPFGELIRH